jgi:hypothetical protein
VSQEANHCRRQCNKSKKDEVRLPLPGLVVLIQERDERKNRLSFTS